MTSYFVLFSFVLFFYFSEEHRFINIKEVKTDLKTEYLLGAMATASTSRTLYSRHLLRIEKILPPVCRVVVCGDEITHDCKI